MDGGAGSEGDDADASEPDRADVSDVRIRTPLGVSFGPVHPLMLLMPSDGGTYYTDSCQGVVIGANGTFDPSTGTTAPRSLQTVCGSIAITVTGTGTYQVTTMLMNLLPVHGDHPASMLEQPRCPKNQMIVGVDTRSGMWVDQLRFLCAPLTISGGPDMYTLSVGSATPIGEIGGDGGGPAPSINCRSGEVVTTLLIHAGDAIDAFGIGCALPSLEFEP
jgi:hypothetical protein